MANEVAGERHLAAIMFVDLVGYSALMQQSESRAMAAVTTLWNLVRPLLAEHRGREVDLAGDGMLTEFSGALSAVRCAIAVHAALHQHNQTLPSADHLRIRAGVHLGDVTHKDGNVYGDGVNIAARLLNQAPPGSTVVSPHVKDQLLNVLDTPLQSLGLRSLKNIKIPLELWCLPGPECKTADLKAAREQDETADRRWLFANAVLDERSLELTVNGAPAELERKSLEVLQHLLHHAGEVVTKDELLEAVWPGRVLSETVLTKCISRIREALNDDDQAIIKTQHGYGYRLVAKVQVEAAETTAAPALDFKAGDHPPLRPLWSLQHCLGQGGHGEVWLAQHDKTKEERVYKFALDVQHLASLKREITLSRLLGDTQHKHCFVRVLDWNLEQIPYFIESEYSKDGSLTDWAQARGGLQTVPPKTRLELAVQIAEALAAAHSVGVLHKDLKPSNVLVEAPHPDPFPNGEGIKIKLADFGSGGVLDPHRLDSLGITRMGFTKTILDISDTTSGTPLYLPPEILAGQPFTSQADIYALGVMLYQLVIGDFRKPLAAGWELDVEDELLRLDIAEAAHGNPARRLPDAAVLATRLRTLEQRRQQRGVEQAALEQVRVAKEETERARQKLERIRARRAGLLVALGVLIVGITLSAVLYVDARRARIAAEAARTEAEVSAATAKAVSSFLTEDLLAAADAFKLKTPVSELKFKDLLDRVAATVDERFKDNPRVAAEVHHALARSYYIFSGKESESESRKAIALFERVYGRDAGQTLDAMQLLADNLGGTGYNAEGIRLQQEVLERLQRTLATHHPKLLRARMFVASSYWALGDYDRAVRETRQLADVIRNAAPADKELESEFEWQMGLLLYFSGDYEESAQRWRAAVTGYSAILGDQAPTVVSARSWLANALARREHFEEAERVLSLASRDAGNDHEFVSWLRRDLGRFRLWQGRPLEAIPLLEESYRSLRSSEGFDAWTEALCKLALAQAYQHAGRLAEAETFLRQALPGYIGKQGADNPRTAEVRVFLADVLRERGQSATAWATLREIAPKTLELTGSRHELVAQLRRVQGLLWLKERRHNEARAALTEALDIYQFRFGPEHTVTRRAREELARVPP